MRSLRLIAHTPRRVLEWGMLRTCVARDNGRARGRLFLVRATGYV
jgi:hypothetical protein